MQIRPLEDLTKDELIALIQREREQYEAVGAGGVSLMGDAKNAEIARLREALYEMVKYAHPAYASDSFFQRNLIEARKMARAALTQQEQTCNTLSRQA